MEVIKGKRESLVTAGLLAYSRFAMHHVEERGMRTVIRTGLVAAGIALLFGICAQRQLFGKPGEEREADRKTITAVLNAQQSAWNRGDVDAFLVGYWHSSELTFSGSSGVARGWDGVLARYKKNYPDRAAMGQLDFSDLEFRFLGPDAALVLGRWHLKRQDEVGGVFSLVWQRFPDGWKIIHDHTSAVTPAK
jgi:ketosteroid isomerase-like protein